MSLLSMLGINLPGLGNSSASGNPFGGLVGGGFPQPPTGLGGAVNPLVQALSAAFRGKLGEQPEPASSPLAALPAGTTAPAYDPSGLPPLAANDPARPAATPKPQSEPSAEPSAFAGIPAPIKAGIFKGEGTHGNYDTLFGHAEKAGGPFEGVKVSQMTVDQAIQFANPKGPYAKYVLATNPAGVLATPMGAYQVVGSTLQKAKEGLGLSGSEPMTPDLQDKIGYWIYKHQGTGAWAGYRGPADPNAVQADTQTYHVGSSRSGGGSPKSRQYAADNPDLFAGRDLPASANGGYRMGEGSFNTATNAPNPHANKSGSGGHGAPSSGDGGGSSGGGSHKNSVSPDYKRYQARQNIKHLRNLSPVATIQALANIGKGLRAEGSKNA